MATHRKQSLVSLAAAVSAVLLAVVSPAAADAPWPARLAFILGSLLFLFVIWRIEGRQALTFQRPIASGLLLVGGFAVSGVFPGGLASFLPDRLALALFLLVAPLLFAAGAVWAAYAFVRRRALQYWFEGAACYFMLLFTVANIMRL